VLATVGQGTQFTIVQVQGTWVGATIEQNGQKLSGWITSADVASSPAPAPAPTVSTGR
jgi:Tfp pilus assembly protein FimT